MPENSLLAFQRAIEAGFPIELDVQFSADKEIFVFHDSELKRMTGKDDTINRLYKHSMRELRLLQTEERIPSLEETLALVNGKVPLLIEIKTVGMKSGTLENGVLNALQGYPGQYAVQSFNPFSVWWFKRYAPDVVIGQLSSVLPLGWLTRPDFVAYDLRFLPPGARMLARRLSMNLLVWTVKTVPQLEKAKRVADNFIFNAVPDILKHLPPASSYAPKRDMATSSKA